MARLDNILELLEEFRKELPEGAKRSNPITGSVVRGEERVLSKDAQRKFVSSHAEGSVSLSFGRYKTSEDLKRERAKRFGW